VIGNLNATKCPSGKPIPRPGGWNAIIARAYPQAAPGTVTHLRAHGSRISLAGESACTAALVATNPKACELKVWIPKRKDDTRARPHVAGRHLGEVSLFRVGGGWLAKAEVRGAYTLTTD
jgi:endoglycosylceramidase